MMIRYHIIRLIYIKNMCSPFSLWCDNKEIFPLMTFNYLLENINYITASGNLWKKGHKEKG